jgi:Beta-L-arabinofuranosidase, GH127
MHPRAQRCAPLQPESVEGNHTVSTPARTLALRAVPASPIAGTRHRPLPIPSVRLVDGPLAAWQQRNGNFRRLLGESDAQLRGPVCADSDLYKVIEAVAWEIARAGTRSFDAWLDDAITLVARAQEPSGYVDTQTDLGAPFDVDDLAVLPAPITVGERDTLVLRCRVINTRGWLLRPRHPHRARRRAHGDSDPVLDLGQPRPRPDAGLAPASSSLRPAMTTTQLMGRQ